MATELGHSWGNLRGLRRGPTAVQRHRATSRPYRDRPGLGRHLRLVTGSPARTRGRRCDEREWEPSDVGGMASAVDAIRGLGMHSEDPTRRNAFMLPVLDD